MAKDPIIRKMFPGGITYQGFYSYYQYLAGGEKNRIYIIKGGPGVGKSTFMKKIAAEILKLGYELEYHCCSTDRNSLDGVYIPQLGIALLDGTAPHEVDPKYPGAVDEIINLGDYWDESKIIPYREDIIATRHKISRFFQGAYFALKDVKNALDEWDFYLEPYQNWQEINKFYLEISEVLRDSSGSGEGGERHLFAWGHTPQGKTQYIDSLIQGTNTLYLLKGQGGTGKATLLARLAEYSKILNLQREIYHNPLEPQKIDLLVLPALKLSLAISSPDYPYNPDFSGEIITLDFDQYLDSQNLKTLQENLVSCRQRIEDGYKRANAQTQQAKSLHDSLEGYYIEAMNFAGIEKKREEVLEEIISYIHL